MAARRTAKKTQPNRSGQKRARWTWNRQSKYVLDCLREFVATGKPLPRKILPKFDYAVEQILAWYQEWVVQRSRIDKQSNSVAGKVMKSLAAQVGGKVVEKWYREARDRSRREFFDCVMRTVLVTRGGSVSNDLNEAVMIRAILEEPMTIDSDSAVYEWFLESMQQRRSSFLLDVAADMKNYDERSDKLDVNPLLLEVATHWVDCHCPMWLMSRKAILKAAKTFAPGNQGWSEESLKRVLRDAKLSGSAKRPIEDIVIKSGKIAGFYVKADLLNEVERTKVLFNPEGSSKTVGYYIIPKAAKKRQSAVRVAHRKMK